MKESKISKLILKWMEDPEKILVNCGSFSVKDFNYLLGVITGNLDNFIVFRNGGGRQFEIIEVSLEDFDNVFETLKSSVFFYMRQGEEIILRDLY